MQGKLFVILLLPALTASAYPLDQPEEIVVHIINKAGLSEGLVKRSMNEVVDIYRLEGFTLTWSECTADGDNPCPWATGYLVCISPERGTMKYDTVTLGYSMLTIGRGNHAVVMWPDVEEFAKRHIASESMILGSTIAHELGHMITRSRKHDQGVMKSVWTGKDIYDMNQRRIRFSPDFVEVMKQQLTDLHTAAVKR